LISLVDILFGLLVRRLYCCEFLFCSLGHVILLFALFDICSIHLTVNYIVSLYHRLLIHPTFLLYYAESRVKDEWFFFFFEKTGISFFNIR